jgi:hypothetical protein
LGNVAHVHQIVAGELGFEDQGSHAMSVPRLFQEYLSCCTKSQKIASVAIAICDSLGQKNPELVEILPTQRLRYGICIAFVA